MNPAWKTPKFCCPSRIRTQEISAGRNPWKASADSRLVRATFPRDELHPHGRLPNLSMLFAPSEAPPTGADRTDPDLLLDRINAAGIAVHGYRLPAPNISYMEVLWYLDYLLVHRCLIPSEFVIQLNFEPFRRPVSGKGCSSFWKILTFASPSSRRPARTRPMRARSSRRSTTIVPDREAEGQSNIVD